jgi:uncharacterized protein Veg
MDLAKQATIVDQIRDTLEELVGERLHVKANMGRSKIMESEGTLTQVHPQLFIMNVDRKRGRTVRQSYQYVDVLTGMVELSQGGESLFQAIIDELAENSVLLDAVREENPALKDCDYFDIISHVAFDQKPLTRKERIDGVKKRNYLAKYEGQARKVIEGLMEKYGEVGVTNIENSQILNMNPFSKIAKRPRIMKGIFKSPEEYNEAVRDLENELYNVAN